jgi:cobyrinic acid a,c-diamide synthase
MRESVASFAALGKPIYAECGGLMYLTRGIQTLDGATHPMVGVVPAEAVMAPKLQALGYVEVETQSPSILGAAGSRFRGHQFRYSDLRGMPDDAERPFSLRKRRDGKTSLEGYRHGAVVASYVHAHWASNPKIAAALVDACLQASK